MRLVVAWSFGVLGLVAHSAHGQQRSCLGGMCLEDGIPELAERDWTEQKALAPAYHAERGYVAPVEVVDALSRYRGWLFDTRALKLLSQVRGVCRETPVSLERTDDDGIRLEVSAEFVPLSDGSQRLVVRELELQRNAPMDDLRRGAVNLCKELASQFPPDTPAEMKGCDAQGATYVSGSGSLVVIIHRVYVSEDEGSERVKLRRIDAWYELPAAEKLKALRKQPGCD